MNTNPSKYFMVMFIIGVVNILSAIACYNDGEMIVDGVLQTGFLNVLCGVSFLITAVELFIKKAIDKREE